MGWWLGLVACRTPDGRGPSPDDPSDEPVPVDADGDGWFSEASGGDDCDDGDATVHPGAEEVWYDGIDQPCDGRPDDDRDGDGASAREAGGRDCDDDDPWARFADNALLRADPADGAVDVLPDTVLQFRLDQADAHARLDVVDGAGEPVAGETTIDDDAVRFTPDAPWAPFDTWTTTLTSLCSTFTLHFSTSDLGQPVVPRSLVGTVWQLDLRTGVVTQPQAVGALLTAGWTGAQLLQIDAVDGNAVAVLGALVGDAATAQDPCRPTFAPADGDLSQNPWITLEPDATWFLGAPAGPGESVLTGLMRGDGSEIVDATWRISADVREAFSPLGAGPICSVLALGGMPCQPCPDGQAFCLEALVEELELVPVDVPLVPRSAAEIAVDPACTAP